MKKNTVKWLVVGGLIGFIIFKNIYKLEKRTESSGDQLQTFENDLLAIEFPNNLVYETDTTYLEDGKLFNTVDGVAGSLTRDGNIVQYSLSIARYNKALTKTESFDLDTLKKNLNQRFANSDSQLLSIVDIEIQGIRGLRYVECTGQYFKKSIIFTLDNNVIAINMKTIDSEDVEFDNIIKSLKIKLKAALQQKHF